MNHSVPDWNMEDEQRFFYDLLSMEKQKKSTGPDQELKELMLKNGHVVMHNQTHRKSPPSIDEFKQTHRLEPASKCGVTFINQSNLIPEDEAVPWFQYPPDYTIDKEFCSEFVYDMPASNAIDTYELNKNISEGSNVISENITKQPTLRRQDSAMPPPKSLLVSSENGNFTPPKSLLVSSENGNFINFAHFSRPTRADLGRQRGPPGKEGTGSAIQGEVVESSSMMTIGSSVCGSNQVQNQTDQSRTLSNGATGGFAKGSKEEAQNRQTDTYETTFTSSSGGSGPSFGRTRLQSVSNTSHKRKGRDGEASGCRSQDCEYESVEASREVQRSKSAHRSRATEVHNLSERRRRDRINEKMRALQELIPHCNKTDKASMLDEAIEYLKSLQLQVQLMWMGGGMTPMMFPGVQHYMSHMGMGMNPATMPSIHGPVPLPRVPQVHQSMHSTPASNQTPMCQSSTFTPLGFPNQIQNIPLPENYARFISFNHMQPSPQAMSLYTYGSHMVQQNGTPMPASTSSSGLPTEGGRSLVNIHNGKSGST